MRESESELIPGLIEQARQGDTKAWEALFDLLGREEQVGRVVLALARRLLPKGDRARDYIESRDILQSALRSGWLHAKEFRGTTKGELLNWLTTLSNRL